jgi:hypothetical protein
VNPNERAQIVGIAAQRIAWRRSEPHAEPAIRARPGSVDLYAAQAMSDERRGADRTGGGGGRADVRCGVMGAAYRHLYGDSPYAELVPLGVSENDPLDAIPFAPVGLAVDGLVDK